MRVEYGSWVAIPAITPWLGQELLPPHAALQFRNACPLKISVAVAVLWLHSGRRLPNNFDDDQDERIKLQAWISNAEKWHSDPGDQEHITPTHELEQVLFGIVVTLGDN